MAQAIEKPVDWLVVGGAPRSGTTALGAALNQSAEIALFHEYASHSFFDALDALFREERRLRNESGFESYEHLIPVKTRDEKALALAVFGRVFDKQPRYIGTKFPGHHAWPQPQLPDWIGFREIWITRNPYDVVISGIRKDHGHHASQKEVEDALFWWISAWNHAVSRRVNANFHHVFYDSLILRQELWRSATADFLGVDDFCFDDLKQVSNVPSREKFARAGLEHCLPLIDIVAEPLDWLAAAKPEVPQGGRLGFPLSFGATIDLRRGGGGSRYVQGGFYAAEDRGSWTRGHQAEILFAPEREHYGPLLVTFELVWVAELHGKGRSIALTLDNIKVFESVVTLGSRNGAGASYTVYVPSVEILRGRAVSLKVLIADPVNPSVTGAGSDDRDLGVMISEIVLKDV
ncbi:sulfotransferase family protein [Paraburkholderia silvatlantica]|uniref:sulfotransferase family protein n=1 Tax=Paraburkholderia silvatlantica TaxID=321895 RepID=UPI00105CFDE6|nr:sulfotransferase [Paraburkholderia silvatlantica]TDQ92425.1 sulfotransferase family protein [Paraburkholderia silvatlantica]